MKTLNPFVSLCLAYQFTFPLALQLVQLQEKAFNDIQEMFFSVIIYLFIFKYNIVFLGVELSGLLLDSNTSNSLVSQQLVS